MEYRLLAGAAVVAAEDRSRDLANVGIDKIERDLSGLPRIGGRGYGSVGGRCRAAGVLEDRPARAVRRYGAADPRWRRLIVFIAASRENFRVSYGARLDHLIG
jgi:hypothetical protein